MSRNHLTVAASVDTMKKESLSARGESEHASDTHRSRYWWKAKKVVQVSLTPYPLQTKVDSNLGL